MERLGRDSGIQSWINDALLKHKQAGNSVCELRNGKVIWIKPQDILINRTNPH